MKKIIFTTILILISNISISLAGQFKSKWGVVLSVTPISITSKVSQPYSKVVCRNENSIRSSNFADIAVGGLIGSVIGNQISDKHGAGAVGALLGSLLTIDNSKSYHQQSCFEQTFYTNKNITRFSHYDIKVRTKRRILNIQSSTPYNVHDVIYLN
jgi:uncharacterized protein YcfJ